MPSLFTITLQVEEEAVGATLKSLKKLRGIVDIDLDLEKRVRANGHDTEAVTARKELRKQFRVPGVKAEDDLMEIMYLGGPMLSRTMREKFLERGRALGSLASALTNLKKDGLAKQAEDGSMHWSLTKLAKDRMRWKKKGATTKSKKKK